MPESLIRNSSKEFLSKGYDIPWELMRQPKGGMGGRHAATTQGYWKEGLRGKI